MRTLLTLWALTSTVVLAAEPPRLGVVIIIDQLSVEAWAARAGREKEGLKRLREHGFSFAEATYESAPTVTAAGHATLATGTWPRIHGIVANQWVDGDTGEKRLSAQDAAYQVLGRDPRPGAQSAHPFQRCSSTAGWRGWRKSS